MGFGFYCDFHNSAESHFKHQRPNCVLASINQTKSVDARHNLPSASSVLTVHSYFEGRKAMEYELNLFTEKPLKSYHNGIRAVNKSSITFRRRTRSSRLCSEI